MPVRTAENWCESQPLCRANLGIPRREMPQIKAPKVKDFLAFLESHGVRVRRTRKAVKDLRATQREINAEIVEQLAQGGVHKLLSDRPMFASEDGYILDGHTRWAALLSLDPDTEVDLMEADVPIRELLSLAWAFPGVEFSTKMAAVRARVALRYLEASTDLTTAFSEAKREAADKLVREWPARIEARFASAFPEWDLAVEMEFVRESRGIGASEESFLFSLRLSPSARHPDKEWAYELDPEVGAAIDRWFSREFGLSPSFLDSAHDMARRGGGFPVHNGMTVQVRW